MNQLFQTEHEVIQGWDTSHPRNLRRSDWVDLPEDVEIALNDIFNMKASPDSHLSSREVQAYLTSKARELWVRDVKSIVVNPEDGEIEGVAEYMGARIALEAVAEITDKIGNEHAIADHKTEHIQSLLDSIENDCYVFIEQCEAQMTAGDVTYIPY